MTVSKIFPQNIKLRLIFACISGFLFLSSNSTFAESFKIVSGAEKFSRGFIYINNEPVISVIQRGIKRMFAAHDYYYRSDKSSEFFLSLSRICVLSNDWHLISGSICAPQLDDIDLVFLLDRNHDKIRILYAQESGGSLILSRFLCHPSGDRIYIGVDWYHDRFCFSRFDIYRNIISRDEDFENASRLAHILLRRIVKKESGGEMVLFFNQNGEFAFSLHKGNKRTSVLATIEFEEAKRYLLLREDGQKRKISYQSLLKPAQH